MAFRLGMQSAGMRPYCCDARVREIVKLVVAERFPIGRVRRPRANVDDVLDACEFLLWSGAPYRALQYHCTAYSHVTIHAYLTKWANAGVFQEAYRRALRLQRRPTRRGATHNAIDTTYVKNLYGRDCIGRNPTDRGRNATKVSALVDSDGVVHSLRFYPGNTPDCHTVSDTLDNRMSPTPRGTALYADKGYDSRAVRHTMQQSGYVDCVLKRCRRGQVTRQNRGQRPRQRTNVALRVSNRRRGIVECVFSWFDKSRRLLMRVDASRIAFEAYSWLACLRILGRRLL
ncbi:hypothetical protein AB1Y20_008575 [Prymnesium parvum]|uniref:Transposase IS4-like domain-containing protein n=1 Tax=Prymnesium parvum TaxID=97485 RepID=A0AB34IQW6_PRYPA